MAAVERLPVDDRAGGGQPIAQQLGDRKRQQRIALAVRQLDRHARELCEPRLPFRLGDQRAGHQHDAGGLRRRDAARHRARHRALREPAEHDAASSRATLSRSNCATCARPRASPSGTSRGSRLPRCAAALRLRQVERPPRAAAAVQAAERDRRRGKHEPRAALRGTARARRDRRRARRSRGARSR